MNTKTETRPAATAQVPGRIVLWSRNVSPNWWFIANKSERADIEGVPVYETLDPIVRMDSPAAAPAAPKGGVVDAWQFTTHDDGSVTVSDPSGKNVTLGYMPQGHELASQLLRDLALALATTPTEPVESRSRMRRVARERGEDAPRFDTTPTGQGEGNG